MTFFLNIIRSRCWKLISVEPVLFFIILSHNVTEFLNTNLYLQKACRINATIEPSLDTPCDNEKRGVLFVSSVYSTFQFASLTLTMLFTLFATMYSDIAGRKRKRFLMLPIFGMLLQNVSACLQAYFWQWPPLIGVILDVILLNMAGGFMCAISFAKIYICDISDRENRVFRMTILTAVRTISYPLSKGMAGYLMHVLGFFYSYIVCAILLLVALILALLLVKDLSQPADYGIGDIFSLKQIIESFKIILWTAKSVRHRIAVFLLLFIGAMVYLSFSGSLIIFLVPRDTKYFRMHQIRF